jgi:hypothetical protein
VELSPHQIIDDAAFDAPCAVAPPSSGVAHRAPGSPGRRRHGTRPPCAVHPVAQAAEALEPTEGALDVTRPLKRGVLGIQFADGLLRLPRVPSLIRELLTWDEGAVKPDQRAIKSLALHEEVQRRSPHPALALRPVPLPTDR